MPLKVCECVSIILSALVVGVFWGPWVALTRSLGTFEAEVFLAISKRTSRNLAPLMTVLMPATLASIATVLFLAYYSRKITFYLTLAGFFLFLVTLRRLF